MTNMYYNEEQINLAIKLYENNNRPFTLLKVGNRMKVINLGKVIREFLFNDFMDGYYKRSVNKNKIKEKIYE